MTWQNDTIENLKKNKIKLNPNFESWIKDKTSENRFFDPLMYHRSHWIVRSLLDDYDQFTVIVGMEGTGKSTMGIQICSTVSPTFQLNNICYQLKDLIASFRTANKGDSILMDEGGMFLFSRESMSETNKTLIKLFMIARQRNLHLAICIPNFFNLDTYIREHRVKTLIEISKRGHYRIFVENAIKLISVYGKKYKSSKGVKLPSGSFHDGYFTKEFPSINDLNMESYRKYKEKHYNEFMRELEEGVHYEKEQSKYITITQYVKDFPCTRETVQRLLNQGKIKGKRVGHKWYIDREALESK